MRKWLFLLVILVWNPRIFATEAVVYFYNWSEYLPSSVLQDFTQQTGIKVVYTTYDSNEAMYAKLKLVNSGYDLTVPSTYYVNKMRREGLLQRLDKTKLPHFSNLDPKLLNKSYDPKNEYSVPYLWGMTGIAVNNQQIDLATVTSWADLWRPQYQGKVLLMNDMREVFHMGLRVLGYSGNDTNETHIQQAYQKLTQLIPNVRLFNSDSPKTPFLEGEVAIGMIWNGEAFMAKKENPAISFVYPKEGAILWMDSLVIPQGAKNSNNAHQLIDFLLQPEIAKRISSEIGYATPNQAALNLLDKTIRTNRTAYPTDEDIKNAEFQIDIGSAVTIYEKYWEKLKI